MVNDYQPVPHEEYDKEYYLTDCGGYHNYIEFHGLKIDERISRSLKLANIGPDMTVLDVGSGRGEIVLHCALHKATAIGIDYSADAIKLASELRNNYDNVSNAMFFMRGIATKLPFKDATFDRIFLLDLVEHLHEQELKDLFKSLRAIIKDDGIIIIHTSPNRLYYEYGYKLIRFFLYLLKRVKLENDIRSHYETKMHINEQTPHSLKKMLEMHDFSFELCLFNAEHADSLIRKHILHPNSHKLIHAVINRSPLNKIFYNDMYAVVWKKSEKKRQNHIAGTFEKIEEIAAGEYRPSSKDGVIETQLTDCIIMGDNDIGVIGDGWYHIEIWPPAIRWTSSKASVYLKFDKTTTKLFVEANICCQDYGVNILIDGIHIKKIVPENAGWNILITELPKIESNIIEVTIEVDETWIPNTTMNNGDLRDLGIAVHKIWTE